MTKHRLLCCLGVIALLIGVSRAKCADEPPAPQKVVTIESITEYHLDNGLRVLLFPDQSRPTVTVNMTVLVGSRHKGYGEAGMAHLTCRRTWCPPRARQRTQTFHRPCRTAGRDSGAP